MSRGRLRLEPTAKRVRAVFDGRIVLDSTDVVLVWEIPNYPQFHVPARDVVAALEPVGEWDEAPGNLGIATRYDVVTADARLPGAAWSFPDHPELAGRVRFDWGALDAWFEEDEEIIVHPRSPFVRVDILPSSRSVRIEIDGVTVAESTRPTLLFETGLPTRHYLPAADVRTELLRPSDSTTSCPYKGAARYHSVEIDGTVHRDIVWHYDAPLRESAPIAGLLSFYDERVDVFVDGRHQVRPRTESI